MRRTRKKIDRGQRRRRRDVLKNRRQISQLEENIDRVSEWGSCINNMLCPIVDERVTKGRLSEEENDDIQEFIEMMDNGFPVLSAEGSDTD